MRDLDTAKLHLDGHSICLCKGSDIMTDDSRGIAPMMKLIAAGTDLQGYSAADLIVGKAAAMLFVKAGIISVFGKVMSVPALDYLKQHDIHAEYDTLTERIINRLGTDICPMEKTVAEISDAEQGYEALKQKLAELRSAHQT